MNFLTAFDQIKLMNLMADRERFKRQSPVTTRDSPAVVKCKRLWTESLEKETATGPCENKDKYRKGITCSHAMLTLSIINLRTKYNLQGFM